jgi:acyl-CoA dehydrogenase
MCFLASTILIKRCKSSAGSVSVKGSVVERLFRHARVYRIFDGTNEIPRFIVARNLLKERGA